MALSAAVNGHGGDGDGDGMTVGLGDQSGLFQH